MVLKHCRTILCGVPRCAAFLVTLMRFFYLLAISASLLACSDFRERWSGYPTQDTVINLETSSPSMLAQALSQLTHMALLGERWEFTDPHDACTVHVINSHNHTRTALDLQGAHFSLQRDAATQQYFAVMQPAPSAQPNTDDHSVFDHGSATPPLRLFKAETYHDVFFAEGYLQALARKCQQSLMHAQQTSAGDDAHAPAITPSA